MGRGARVDANQERPVTPPSRGGPVAMEAIRDVLQNGHEDPDQVSLASDTDDGGGDSSEESFDYDYSDGGPVSEPEEGGSGRGPLAYGGPDGSSPVHERNLRRNARLSEARNI